MRDQGIRPVTLRLTGGQQVVVKTNYFSCNEHTARRGKGLYPGLLLLGIHHRCTPALADRVAQLSAAMASFEEAQEQLRYQGIHLSVITIGAYMNDPKLAPYRQAPEPVVAVDPSTANQQFTFIELNSSKTLLTPSFPHSLIPSFRTDPGFSVVQKRYLQTRFISGYNVGMRGDQPLFSWV